jgi:hypothetical protein
VYQASGIRYQVSGLVGHPLHPGTDLVRGGIEHGIVQLLQFLAVT